MNKLTILAFCLLAAGCTTANQQLAQRAQADQRTVDEICRVAVTNPELAPLRTGAFPQDALNPTMEQLADRSRPDPAQKNAIARHDAVYANCVAARAQYLGVYFGQASRQNYEAFDLGSKALRAKLWSGEMTIGEYNQAAATLGMQSRARAQAIAEELRQRRVAADRDAANAISQSIANMPKTTTCNSFGTQTTCTTR